MEGKVNVGVRARTAERFAEYCLRDKFLQEYLSGHILTVFSTRCLYAPKFELFSFRFWHTGLRVTLPPLPSLDPLKTSVRKATLPIISCLGNEYLAHYLIYRY